MKKAMKKVMKKVMKKAMKVSKIARGKRAKSSVFKGTKAKTVGSLLNGFDSTTCWVSALQ